MATGRAGSSVRFHVPDMPGVLASLVASFSAVMSVQVVSVQELASMSQCSYAVSM